MWSQEQQFTGHILGTAAGPPKARNVFSVTIQKNIHYSVHSNLIKLVIRPPEIINSILADIMDQMPGIHLLQRANIFLAGEQTVFRFSDLPGRPGIHLSSKI